ncbi:class I SAM-dependent methyltransferase [Marinilabiliaceae bacterium JC017]|nr:class I SAM-dependent methyltransferase [Marinilabiliaceae bacterium JC017]
MDNTFVKKTFNLKSHAGNYDLSAKKSNWHAPEIAFGLSYQYIKPGEAILDLGIGTGLSSVLYHQAGLRIYGIDFSEKMLEVCAGKKMTVDLKQHDLLQAPYPYESNSINHAVCSGVFHVFKDLSVIFNEMQRILQNNGLFVFSVIDCDENESRAEIIKSHKFSNEQFTSYRYTYAEINELIQSHGFSLRASVVFEAIHVDRKTKLKMYLAQKD